MGAVGGGGGDGASALWIDTYSGKVSRSSRTAFNNKVTRENSEGEAAGRASVAVDKCCVGGGGGRVAAALF